VPTGDLDFNTVDYALQAREALMMLVPAALVAGLLSIPKLRRAGAPPARRRWEWPGPGAATSRWAALRRSARRALPTLAPLLLGVAGFVLWMLVMRNKYSTARAIVDLPLWAIDLYVCHIPALYEVTLTSAPLHALEHGMFIFFGCLMWMPVLGPLPKPDWFNAGWKVIYVIAVRFVGTVLGNAFIWSGTVFYPAYEPGNAAHNISPLTDQGIAGAIMLGEGMIVTLAVLAWAFLKWAADTTERQRLLDLAEARGIELDEARAARAVAAGQGKHLEERLRAGEPGAPDPARPG